MSALYMSMSANETELEIEDELAKGKGYWNRLGYVERQLTVYFLPNSTKDLARTQVQDLLAVQEELRPRKGRPVSRFTHCPAYPEPHGARRTK